MWYWFFWFLCLCVCRALYRVRVEGLGNLPKKTNFILASNHVSYIDATVLGQAIPRRVYWLVDRKLFKDPIIGWLMSRLSSHKSGGSTERLIRLLERNKNIAIFPEGKINIQGGVGTFKTGTALLALKTGRPIVPCAIMGTFDSLPFGKMVPKIFIPITIKVGKPIYFLKEFEDVVSDAYLQDITAQIREGILNLIKK